VNYPTPGVTAVLPEPPADQDSVPASGTRQFALSSTADGPGGSIADVPDDELLDGFGS
jgi:hypothetical protein